MKFKVVKKGYDIVDVDNYVEQAEKALNGQKERISALKKKITGLEAELAEYGEKKDLILAALSGAVAKAEKIEDLANKKYEAEIYRLRRFHEKWTGYYSKLIKKYPLELRKTTEFNRDMDRILKESDWDDGIAPVISRSDALYMEEKERVINSDNASASELTPLERIKNYLDAEKGEGAATISISGQPLADSSQADAEAMETTVAEEIAPSENGVFSLDEALHPKQGLVEIMKDLGLIEE